VRPYTIQAIRYLIIYDIGAVKQDREAMRHLGALKQGYRGISVNIRQQGYKIAVNPALP
jgi:hypothetical protein